MNEIYNKWLLVSDIDGTLNSKSMKLPENNKIAINNFVNNGGNFTLCSGRNLQSLSIHYKKLGINTPAIFLNGAGIYDFKNQKMIYENFITSQGEEIILDILKKYKLAQLTVFTADKILLATRKCIYGLVISKMDKLDHQLCKKVSDLPRGIWGKVSFFGTKSLINKLKDVFSNEEYSNYFECFKTSPFTLEVVNKGVNKGAAVLKLAELLNIDESNTAAIGDYYNDVEMLKRVAHPVCCGQAPDDIKDISEYVACHCNDGAVADFIDYIQTNYIK
ncbi:MAG: Cof-type HAD-IIB family hydrolase [Acutalibacteraceae bacterium]|nr:Cof-type HAD-IIB family hydrolase [Acutalibacteraceae bacterium]